jgi:RHS repeat-associated protein
MQMPGRSFNADSYRYGFNGKENDNEVKGESNQQDYGQRIYDPRMARFLSEDPLTKDYPELSPYQFASNSPIENSDLDGLESLSEIKGGLAKQMQMRICVSNLDQLHKEQDAVSFKAMTRRYESQPPAIVRPANNNYPEGLERHEANRAAKRRDAGLNPDGSKAGWVKLAESKGWNNLAVPMAEQAVGEGVGRLAFKGISVLAGTNRLTFYTIQSEADATRLANGGMPWPTGPTRAHFGEGLYTWGSKAEADAYLGIKISRPGVENANLRIMEFSIKKSDFRSLNKFIVPTEDGPANLFLGKHSSLFGEGAPHGYDYIRRDGAAFTEHYFSKDVFPLLKLKK